MYVNVRNSHLEILTCFSHSFFDWVKLNKFFKYKCSVFSVQKSIRAFCADLCHAITRDFLSHKSFYKMASVAEKGQFYAFYPTLVNQICSICMCKVQSSVATVAFLFAKSFLDTFSILPHSPSGWIFNLELSKKQFFLWKCKIVLLKYLTDH